MKPGNFETLSALLHAGSGLVIGPDKLYLLENRLGPVMKKHGLSSLDAVAERVRLPAPGGAASGGISSGGIASGGLAGQLEQDVIEAMTTNESFFFRDEKPFTHFRVHALPRLLAARPQASRLRIWSAASSTGQEAYSLAMILADARAQLCGRSIEIIGTDLAREPLARAQEGLYTQFEVQRGLPIQSLVKYFRKEGANWRIADTIRSMVQFRLWNLLSDLKALGQFDIVFCRNVLIYFDQPTKSKVLDAIARQMPSDGILYLGGAETVLGLTESFAAQAGERGVYERTVATPSRPAAALAQANAGR